ncbi:hypothetical protein R2F61_07395 [Mollicutes bacterium LVI A0078]|nr:hypothetical protein R2F61_07395 [Mollicutes bacterium LVI A0078]
MKKDNRIQKDLTVEDYNVYNEKLREAMNNMCGFEVMCEEKIELIHMQESVENVNKRFVKVLLFLQCAYDSYLAGPHDLLDRFNVIQDSYEWEMLTVEDLEEYNFRVHKLVIEAYNDYLKVNGVQSELWVMRDFEDESV